MLNPSVNLPFEGFARKRLRVRRRLSLTGVRNAFLGAFDAFGVWTKTTREKEDNNNTHMCLLKHVFLDLHTLLVRAVVFVGRGAGYRIKIPDPAIVRAMCNM